MYLQKWTRLLLLIPLLVSAIGLSPAQAAGPALAADDTKIIWCPAAVSVPVSGKNGCTAAFSNVVGLWDAFVAKKPAVAGTIWLGKGYIANDTDQFWDGSAVPIPAKYPLTFKGGWNGLGTGTVDLSHPTLFDGKSLVVGNWKGSVTLRNITVQNASSSTPQCTAAVCVITGGSIKLDRVQVNQRTNLYGIYLINTNGGADTTAAAMTITNTKIINNRITGAGPQNGLTIYSNGTVTLANVYSEGNDGSGAFIDNTFGSGDVILNGTNTFLDNAISGLAIFSKGNVTARYLLAYKNLAVGAEIYNNYAASAKSVAITSSGGFKGNDKGLVINSKGSVSLTRVQSVSNTHIGIDVLADGKVTLICSGVYGTTTAPGSGLYVRKLDGSSAVPAVVLKGFLSYMNLVGNTPNEDVAGAPITRTACP